MNISCPGRLVLVPLGLAAWIGMAVTVLGATAPPNDNFANAIAISGFWGTTNVDISGATAEIGEPEIAGVRATRSVWYKFTPVLDGVVTVHTFGSAVDTRLSVFIVPANTNVAVNSSLFPVVANDDLSLTAGDPASPALAGPNGPEVTRGPSAVQFPAKMGVTYYVAVDGRAGQVQLTWGYNFGGLFYMPKAFVTNPYNPVFVEAAKTEGTIQFSVSRAFGYSGQVQVTVVTTNLPEIYYQATNAAIPGTDPTTDYTAATNILTFDDFEMTKTFRVRIREARYVPPPPVDPPDTNAPPIAPFYANRYFGVKIVDVRFSSQENTNLLEPPTIMSGNEISVGRMLDVNIPYGTGDDPSGNVPAFTNNVINFAVKHQTTTEYLPGDGDGFVHIVLTRNGTGDPSQGCSIGWAINSLISWGDLMNNQFDVWPESDYATPTPPTTAPPGAGSADFGLPSIGTVSWGGYDFIPKEVLIPIYDDDMVEFNEDFYIEMIPESATSCVMGEVNSSVVTILFDGNDQPAGALEGGYNAHNEPPNNPFPGANAAIFALAVQPADQSVVIGGAFTSYNAFLRNRIARVNYDGSIDQNFTVGTGADGLVTSLALQPDGKIVMGGDFRAVNGDNRYRVARLMASGTVDATFNPGLGADDTVWSLALSTNGSVVIGGQFNTFNNYTLNHVARLSSSGDVDLSFDTSNLGLDGTVWAVAPQEDGKVVIGGDFTMVNGFQRSRIARLNADGSVDTTFDPGLGANDTIYTLLVQPDRNILVGGAFSQFHIASHRGLTRLLSTGALDPTFNPGSSANDVVYSLFLPPDSSRIYVGGMFTEFNSTRRVGLARLYLNGTVDTGFMDTAYNQFAGIPNPVFNPDLYPHNTVFAIGLEQVAIPSGTNFVPVSDVIIGGSFNRVGGGGFTRRSWDWRYNLTLLRGGSTMGPGNFTITYPSGSGKNNANKDGQLLNLTLTRENGTLGTTGVRFSPDPLPVGQGAAIYGQDYSYDPLASGQNVYGTTWSMGLAGSRMLSDGIWSTNYPYSLSVLSNLFVSGITMPQVDIISNAVITGNRSYSLNLSMPAKADTFFLGGANIPLGTALGAEPSAPSTIIDNRNQVGTFTFITTNYTISETGGSASIMVIRTNGSDDTVTMTYKTFDILGTPPTGIGYARSNINYYPTTGKLTFYPGITNQSFNVGIRSDGHVDPDLALMLVITNITAQHPMNGTALGGTTNAWLTIIDGDFPQGRLNFSTATFSTNETAGNALITVTRTGGSQGTITVLCSTTNTPASTAVPYVNYLPRTNVSLVWSNGDSSPKTLAVPLLHDNQITSNLTVGLQLSSPVLNGLTNYQAFGVISNSVLTILNVDNIGALSFSSPTYAQNENGGFAVIPVLRQGGSVGSLSANFNATIGLNMAAGVDFTPTNGTLSFGPGEVSKIFTVPLIDGHHVDVSNRAVVLQLTNSVPAGVLSSPSTALLNIFSDGFNQPPGGIDPTFHPAFNGVVNAVALQPNGAIVAGGAFTVANAVTRNRLARLNSDGSLDFTFASAPGQANDTVRTLALQSDGRILIGGDFTTYDGFNRSHFARVNLDGTLDWQFDPGSAFNHTPYVVVETFTDTNKTTRKILVGGSFTLANGAPRNYLAQFDNSGSVDLGFNANNGNGGLDGAVWAIAVQTDHKIVIGGDFLSVNGVARPHIARLNADGSFDASFNNPGTGANDSVRALTIQLDGRILVGGLFTNFNGTVQNRIVRLNADGSIDPTFNGGVGADGAVYAIAVQADTGIVLGGEFTRYGGVTRNRLTRLNPDGSVDPAINFGAGFDNYVASLVVQTNDSIVLGGGFTTYDESPAPYLTRVFSRSIAGSGTFEFTSATFGANETASNAVVTVRRRGGTSAPDNGSDVYVTVATSDGPPPNGAIFGINYTNLSGVITNTSNLTSIFTNTFPPGETVQSMLIPMLHDFQVTPDLTVNLQLTDIEPLTLPVGLGNQPIAELIITNVDSAVQFSSATYSIAKNAQEGRATIPIYRLGSTTGTSSIDFMTTTNGTAKPYGRYVPLTNTVVFDPGQTVQNVFITISNDNQVVGDQTVTMLLANPTNTLLSAPAAATLTILEISTAPGTIAFSSPSYVVHESSTNAYLNVLRTNGVTGAVTVNYFTRDGTAIAGLKYLATNGTLVFADGETSKTIVVPIIKDANVTGDEMFSVTLTNVTGGATLIGPPTVPVTIIDDNVGISLTSPIYTVLETAGTVSLSVFRQNGTNLTTTVQYSTADQSAISGVNYVGVTNAVLVFNPGETVKSFSLNILHDPKVTGNRAFAVNLSPPSSPAQLFNFSSAVVNILDADPGLSFGSTNLVVVTNAGFPPVTVASYGVLKSATNVFITVIRSNANSGVISVNYATVTNLNDSAVAGVDYGQTSGLLTFSNNVSVQSFTVPIFNNRQVGGDRTFSINLFNPSSGVQLIPPSVALVTITNDVAGISFSSSDYRVNENGGAATITVFRTGYTNSIVSVDYATANTPQAGTSYASVSGTFVFTNGQTVKTFTVPVIDDGVLNGDVVVPLSLGNLGGNVVFVNPSAANLTIMETDGSRIVPAGAAIVKEIGQVNGVIDPGETVTMLFALRDSTGTNTGNLVSTLINGATSLSGPQSYGSLVARGPAVSKEFTFRADGTNGQIINIVFQLQDGGLNRGQAVFSFMLGQTANSFASYAPIFINDKTNASPYPSVINVNGLASTVTKATVTLTNLSHTWPSDIDALLVSPTGQKSYLMAKCGSRYTLNNVTLTFDDSAASTLPPSSQIVSGTNRPTSYALATPPFPPAFTPPPPYSTNLAVFNGSNPNGNWSLFVIDDAQGNSGVISNGWSLQLLTAGVVPAAADVGLTMAITNIPPTVVQTTNLYYFLTLTNYGPSTASNIVVTDVLPQGMAFGSGIASPGSVSNNAGVVTWTVASLAKDASASLTLIVRANNIGTFSNSATVTTGSTDLNPDDDTASAEVTVISPIADLAISLVDAPEPVLLGNYVTSTITVSNGGPATATGLVVSDLLPPLANFISAEPANRYTFAGGIVTFANLDPLPRGGLTYFTVVFQPTVADTIINSAVCRSDVVDPFKANNSASVKTIVQSLPLVTLDVSRVGNSLVISWPTNELNYNLYSTTNLVPALWTPVTNSPSAVGTQNTVIVPISGGSEYFRLQTP